MPTPSQREIPLYLTRSGPVVSFMFLDRLQANAGGSEETSLMDVLSLAYTDCYGKKVKLDQETAEAIADALPKPGDRKGPANAGKPPEKGLGSDYLKWLGSLQSDRLCYILSGFDAGKARTLYADTDYRIVQDMGESYLEQQWHKIQSSFEASMYGFGGGYKDGAGGGGSDEGEVITYDLTTPEGKKEAMGALRECGFVK